MKGLLSTRHPGWLAAACAALLAVPQLQPSSALAGTLVADTVATVTGVLTLPDGRPASDARVSLEALAVPPVSGAPVDIVAAGVTDKAGRLALRVEVTDALRTAAARNGGALNVELFAEQVEEAPLVPAPAPAPAPMPSGDCIGCFGAAAPTGCLDTSVLQSDNPRDALAMDDDALHMLSMSESSSSSVADQPTPCVSTLPSPDGLVPDDMKEPDLSRVTEQAGQRPTWVVTHAFYLGLLNTGNGDLATAFAPVNVGTLLLGEITSEYTADAPELAPAPQQSPPPPSSGSDEPLADTITGYPIGDTQHIGMVSEVHLVTTPHDEAPAVETRTNVSGAVPGDEIMDSPIMPAPPSENEAYDPVGRCRHEWPKNRNARLVDVLERRNEWQPVTEVHASAGMKVEYQRGQTADDTVGVSYKHEGKGWKVNGSVEIKNKGAYDAELPIINGKVGHYVDAEFRHVRERITNCGDTGNYPYVYFRVRALDWTGGLQIDTSKDLRGWDTKAGYDEAYRKGFTTTIWRGEKLRRTTAKSFKYTAGVEAFGVTLSAQSDFSESSWIRWYGNPNREYSHLFGNDNVVKSASIVYSYD